MAEKTDGFYRREIMRLRIFPPHFQEVTEPCRHWFPSLMSDRLWNQKSVSFNFENLWEVRAYGKKKEDRDLENLNSFSLRLLSLP